MTIVSNDPSLWPMVSHGRVCSYSAVASLTVVVYDSALTFGQEIELIWRQRWSLITVLYLSVRYIGIPYTVFTVIEYSPYVSLTMQGTVLLFVMNWTILVLNIILGVIVLARLHVMCHQSRKLLVFLDVLFLTLQIGYGVVTAINSWTGIRFSEEFVFSGAHRCNYHIHGYSLFLMEMAWIFGTAWEVLTVCLAVWSAVRYFRELQRPSTGWTVENYCMILLKTHVFYFLSFALLSSFHIMYLSSLLQDSPSTGAETRRAIYDGILIIAEDVQMFILEPRLILGIREYHAKLVANSDEGNELASMVFQDCTHISTGGSV